MLTTSILSSLAFFSVALVAAKKDESAKYNYFGNLSPYHKGPVPDGVNEELPEDCRVDQVMFMGRHGSRWPLASELVFIQGLQNKLGNASQAIEKANLPNELKFLKSGYKTTLGANNLTAIGRGQIFKHGVDFRLKYPSLKVTSVLAGDQDRVIESAQWFSQGYFGRDWPSLESSVFSKIPEDDVTISWITPMDTCPRWQYAYGNNATVAWGKVYLPPITKRLNEHIPGANLTNGDTHGALYACAYDYAAHGTSPWCDVFTSSELSDFEYELDLLMNYAFGYGLPEQMGPILGTLFVNKLVERFTNATGDAAAVYIEFGHDTTIDMALSALGLAKDSKPLPVSGPVPPHRNFRTSYQVPFGAQMVWERFSCKSSFEGSQIRLVLNDAPVPLQACAKSKADKEFGSCSLSEFVKSNSFSTSIKWGDKTWNATCGAANF